MKNFTVSKEKFSAEEFNGLQKFCITYCNNGKNMLKYL